MVMKKWTIEELYCWMCKQNYQKHWIAPSKITMMENGLRCDIDIISQNCKNTNIFDYYNCHGDCVFQTVKIIENILSVFGI